MNPSKAFEIDNGIIIDGKAGIYAYDGDAPTEPAYPGSIGLGSYGIFVYGLLGWLQVTSPVRNYAGQLDFANTKFSHWIPTL